MKVSGKVMSSGRPVPDAAIRVYIGNAEIAQISSDDGGKFEHKDSSNYLGQTLMYKATSDGYENRSGSTGIEQDAVELNIELEKISLPLPPPLSPDHRWVKHIGAPLVACVVGWVTMYTNQITYFSAFMALVAFTGVVISQVAYRYFQKKFMPLPPSPPPRPEYQWFKFRGALLVACMVGVVAFRATTDPAGTSLIALTAFTGVVILQLTYRYFQNKAGSSVSRSRDA